MPKLVGKKQSLNYFFFLQRKREGISIGLLLHVLVHTCLEMDAIYIHYTDESTTRRG